MNIPKILVQVKICAVAVASIWGENDENSD